MKSQSIHILLLSILIVLTPVVHGFCNDEKCLTNCLWIGTTHEKCISQCCNETDENTEYLSSCNQICRSGCAKKLDELTNENDKCFAQCVMNCSQNAQKALSQESIDDQTVSESSPVSSVMNPVNNEITSSAVQSETSKVIVSNTFQTTTQQILNQIEEDEAKILKFKQLQLIYSSQNKTEELDILSMIDQEISNRQQIESEKNTKKQTVLREMAISSFESDIETSYLTSGSLVSFASYKMEIVNERIISEAHNSSSNASNNGTCNFDCGSECFGNEVILSYIEKQACLSEQCSCNLNLYYYEDICDTKCQSNCVYLSDEDSFDICITQCGCDTLNSTYNMTNQSIALSRFEVSSASIIHFVEVSTSSSVEETKKMSSFKKFYLILMGIVAIVSTIVTLQSIRELTKKHNTIIQQAPTVMNSIRKQRKTKILDKKSNQDNDSFVIEEAYEKIL